MAFQLLFLLQAFMVMEGMNEVQLTFQGTPAAGVLAILRTMGLESIACTI
jgi:hypothetical protein